MLSASRTSLARTGYAIVLVACGVSVLTLYGELEQYVLHCSIGFAAVTTLLAAWSVPDDGPHDLRALVLVNLAAHAILWFGLCVQVPHDVGWVNVSLLLVLIYIPAAAIAIFVVVLMALGLGALVRHIRARRRHHAAMVDWPTARLASR